MLPHPISFQAPPYQTFRKEDELAHSPWRPTPKEAREDLSEEIGVDLKSDNIVYEQSFLVPIRVVDEEF